MGDLFGNWIDPHERKYSCGSVNNLTLKESIFSTVEGCTQHTFVFLTKATHNLQEWGKFPDNSWVGTSVTGTITEGMKADLLEIKKVDASIRFVSFEPLLNEINTYSLSGLDWIVIGAATAPYHPPRLKWVQEIEKASDRLHIPVFEKNNLARLLGRPLRQELPKYKI